MNKRAFTLIEVIVSALILTLATGGVLFIFSTEKGAVSRTGRRMQAMDFARQTLEQLRNKVGADTWPTGGDISAGTHTTEAFLSLSGTELGDKFGGTREYTVTDKNPDVDAGIDYKEVTVEVKWTEPEVPK
ncbi:MAG: type II secretion system GspH family protein [Candidatus Omnitrophica bacterium]|nr:type II secretion system GspH family protein [Candidatus Omnitrophota bacterium]